MIEAMKQALEALEEVQEFMNTSDWFNDKITSLRQAIAELESQEPDKYTMDIECTKCGSKQSGVLTVNTHPQQRKPLTDEQIYSMVADITDVRSPYLQFARAIEAAHGIKE